MPFFPGKPQGIEADLLRPVRQDEPENRYELPDGTVMLLRVVTQEIWRAVSEKDPQGQPLYVVKSQNLMSVIPPPSSPAKSSH